MFGMRKKGAGKGPEGLRQAHQAREGHGPEDAGARSLAQADREEAGQVALDGELRGGVAQVRVSATVKTTIWDCGGNPGPNRNRKEAACTALSRERSR